jgi:hypothetical protein
MQHNSPVSPRAAGACIAGMIRTPHGATLTSNAALLLSRVIRLLVCHGGSRESAPLLQRGGVVGRFRYRIREEQARAAVAATVAKRKPASAISDEQSDRQLSANASRRQARS